MYLFGGSYFTSTVIKVDMFIATWTLFLHRGRVPAPRPPRDRRRRSRTRFAPRPWSWRWDSWRGPSRKRRSYPGTEFWNKNYVKEIRCGIVWTFVKNWPDTFFVSLFYLKSITLVFEHHPHIVLQFLMRYGHFFHAKFPIFFIIFPR